MYLTGVRKQDTERAAGLIRAAKRSKEGANDCGKIAIQRMKENEEANRLARNDYAKIQKEADHQFENDIAANVK